MKKLTFENYMRDGYNPNAIKKIPKEVVKSAALSIGMAEHTPAAAVALAMTGANWKCVSCEKQCKLISYNQGFRKFCSAKCSNNSQEVVSKKKETSLKKYGTEFPNQSKVVKEKIKEKLIDRVTDTVQTVVEMIEEQGFKVTPGQTLSDSWNFMCSCGNSFSLVPPTWSRWNTGWKTICPKCSKGSSYEEKEISNWIENLGFEIIRRDRSIIAPLELDIFIPKLNLAIEYNGLYWHSDDKWRHFNKYKLCKERGIKLIQIFENEWMNKKDKVKSRLMSALHLNTRLYARKTQVRKLSYSEAKRFFEENHLNSYSRGGFAHYGLVCEGKIVQCITVGKSRFYKKIDYELLRSASLNGITVVGGLSKLINHALSQSYGSLVSYADLCWGDGSSYALAGGEELHYSQPGYAWWRKNEMLSRFNSMKKNLKNVLQNYDEKLTEEENMRAEGWRQIWNAGNAIYVWRVK